MAPRFLDSGSDVSPVTSEAAGEVGADQADADRRLPARTSETSSMISFPPGVRGSSTRRLTAAAAMGKVELPRCMDCSTI
jgi:hypothetical protein